MSSTYFGGNNAWQHWADRRRLAGCCGPPTVVGSTVPFKYHQNNDNYLSAIASCPDFQRMIGSTIRHFTQEIKCTTPVIEALSTIIHAQWDKNWHFLRTLQVLVRKCLWFHSALLELIEDTQKFSAIVTL